MFSTLLYMVLRLTNIPLTKEFNISLENAIHVLQNILFV